MSMGYKQSSALPPIGSLDAAHLKREELEYQYRKPALPALSTTIGSSVDQGPASPQDRPLPYKFSGNSSMAPSVAFMISSNDSRKSHFEDKAAAPNRLSLPSISEALGSGPVPAPPSSSNSYQHISPQSPHFTWRTPSTDTYPISHARSTPQPLARQPYIGRISPATPAPAPTYPQRNFSPKPVAPEKQSTRLAEHQTYTAPQTLSEAPHRTPQEWPPQIPNQYESRSHPGPTQPQYPYPPPFVVHQLHAPPPPPPMGAAYMQVAAPTIYNPPPFAAAPVEHAGAWRSDDESEDGARPRPSYGDSVKRHLDVFDLESALNEMVDCSKRVSQFGSYYCERAHQTQKSGPLPGATPSIGEIDEMVKNGNQIQDSLSKLREVIVSQQAALAERSKDQMLLHKAAKHPAPDDISNYQDSKDGGFGGDAKKRRGRAAPPGRCHSCNRAETPEWRRGPDGARTLCNACGLHYAKLTRKMGANKAPIGSSNLRPKSMGPGSPHM